jgi:uncharacterized protein (TIGR02996 family)
MIRKRFEARGDFYELTLREKRVDIVAGKRAADATSETRTFRSVAEAQFYVADRARERQNTGFREVVYEESYDGGQRDAKLEAVIEGAPADPAGYLVYADWLQQHDEPRGELIVVQHGLAAAPKDKGLREAERALFDAHSDRLRGPLALIEEAKVEWFCGFLRAVELGIWLSAMGRTLVRPLLSHPSARFLQRFAGTAGNDTDLAPLAELAPPTLRRLELDGNAGQISALQRAFAAAKRPPPLEHIKIGNRTYRGLGEWLADAGAAAR